MALWNSRTEYPAMAKKTTVRRGPYNTGQRQGHPWARNQIGAWRRHKGITQEALSEEADLSPGQISDIEKGTVGFSAESLAAISEALGVPRGKLSDEEPPKKRG